MATLSATLENHLGLFELSRSMHEAQKVRRLSILASVFLPLSLASSLLGMQTRFTCFTTFSASSCCSGRW
ncbi:hypothetical protein DM02DRAFT_615709 [Periconia macrospinosa]|uniref:Uncharacterized protein n=1 Tax=Periconia macrospinosa TaxID=97972 RepID=A0A2V1DK73_9PLEO|nr:hypothetical protein DM02DRAFT_615709 [Periconia macrospinosa]